MNDTLASLFAISSIERYLLWCGRAACKTDYPANLIYNNTRTIVASELTGRLIEVQAAT